MKIWIKNPLGILAKNSDGGLIVEDKKILELIPSGKTPSSNYDSIFDNFSKSVKFLNQNFGQLDIPLGDLLLLKRGDIELPLDGAPDVLRAIYSKLDDIIEWYKQFRHLI